MPQTHKNNRNTIGSTYTMAKRTQQSNACALWLDAAFPTMKSQRALQPTMPFTLACFLCRSPLPPSLRDFRISHQVNMLFAPLHRVRQVTTRCSLLYRASSSLLNTAEINLVKMLRQGVHSYFFPTYGCFVGMKSANQNTFLRLAARVAIFGRQKWCHDKHNKK